MTKSSAVEKIVIRSVLRLRPKTDGHRDVLAFYEQREILDRALADGGCTAAEVQVRLPNRDEIVVSALWRSVSDYQAWADSASRAADVSELEGLLAADAGALGTADLYEVTTSLPRTR
jgi:heme-degrading monooxygenase HmoA